MHRQSYFSGLLKNLLAIKFYNIESEQSDWQKLLKTCQLNQGGVVFVALCVLKCSWLPCKRVCNTDCVAMAIFNKKKSHTIIEIHPLQPPPPHPCSPPQLLVVVCSVLSTVRMRRCAAESSSQSPAWFGSLNQPQNLCTHHAHAKKHQMWSSYTLEQRMKC